MEPDFSAVYSCGMLIEALGGMTVSGQRGTAELLLRT